ncbi:MAG: hypothetical protein IJA48_01915 [Oscillospiraceae bacterium]|nr:hypothetical protein [Oscillospiraceae bacterium]
MKRRLGGILHAATPLFCKVFGEFVLPARIPPDRLKGDPTPFDKGVFGASNSSKNICLTLVPRAQVVRLYEVRWGVLLKRIVPEAAAHGFAFHDSPGGKALYAVFLDKRS